MESEKPISNIQNQYSCTGTGRVQVYNSPWPEHGLLHHQIGPWFVQNMHHYFSVGKYSYLQLPMGIACSHDIFQAKMSELMVALEFVQVHIDNLLCITKGSLDDHLSKLRQVLIRLRCAWLKVNAAKCSFCATETEYLGYVLTREGTKPQQKRQRLSSRWHRHRISINYVDFWAWSCTTETSGRDEVKCSHSSPT